MNKHLLLFLLLAGCLIYSGCKKISPEIQKPNFPLALPGDSIFDVTNAIADSLNITAYSEMYISDMPLTGSTIRQNRYWRKCSDSISADIFSITRDHWFRFTVQNNSPLVFKRLFCPGNFDYAELNCANSPAEKTGTMVPIRDWSYAENNFCLAFSLNNDQIKTFFLYIKRGSFLSDQPLRFILRTEQRETSRQAFEIKQRMADTVFLFFYLGFLFFCFIYFLAQFIYRSHEKILIIYALYILFTLLYSFRDIDKHYFLQTSFPFFNGINVWGEAIFSYLAYIFYSLFIIYLLELKEKKKSVFIFIAIMICVMAVLLMCDVVLRFSGNHPFALTLFHQARGLLFPLTILYFLLIIPLFNDKYYKYFLYGTIFIGLGTALNLLVHVFRYHPGYIFNDLISSKYGFWANPVNYTRLGIIMEVLFFSLGIAKKIQLEFAEAILKQGTSVDTEFYIHEIQSGLRTLEDKLDEESQAAQYSNRYMKYLKSTLKILKTNTEVELEDEIDMARKYFILRQEDDDRFEFSFTNTSGISTTEIKFPAGLLIPFVQNFFRHAIDDGFDKFQFGLLLYKKGKKINLAITDNGKGIVNPAVLQKDSSNGLKIARDKINIYNTFSGSKIDFTIKNNKIGRGIFITITNLSTKNGKAKSDIG